MRGRGDKLMALWCLCDRQPEMNGGSVGKTCYCDRSAVRRGLECLVGGVSRKYY